MLLKLLLIALGLIITIIGFICFIACIYWMIKVTTDDHDLGSFRGQFWNTLGQEIVLIGLILSWSLAFYGIFLMFKVPLSWSLKKLFFVLFLPSAIIWVIAKLAGIIDMLKDPKGSAFRIIYTGILLWQIIVHIGLFSFVPKNTVGEYYGSSLNVNQLFSRTSQTILIIVQIRFFRSEVEDKSTLIRYLEESFWRYEKWHSKREERGGIRNLDTTFYKKEGLPLLYSLKSKYFIPSKSNLVRAQVDVFNITDRWWIDDPNWGKTKKEYNSVKE